MTTVGPRGRELMHKQPKPPPLIRTDISPQEALAEFLDRCGYDGSEYVPQLFATHAHELAERQRQYAEDTLDYDAVVEPGELRSVIVAAVSVVADLIDPKARGRV